MRIRQRSNRRGRIQVWRRAQLFDHVGFDDAKAFLILSCEFTFSSKTDGELEENERKKEYSASARRRRRRRRRRSKHILIRGERRPKMCLFKNRRLCPTTDTKMTKRRIKKRCRLTFRLFTPLFEKMVSRALLTHTNNFPVVRWPRGRLDSRALKSCSAVPTLGLPGISWCRHNVRLFSSRPLSRYGWQRCPLIPGVLFFFFFFFFFSVPPLF